MNYQIQANIHVMLFTPETQHDVAAFCWKQNKRVKQSATPETLKSLNASVIQMNKRHIDFSAVLSIWSSVSIIFILLSNFEVD